MDSKKSELMRGKHKAAKIMAVLRTVKDIRTADVLDVGAGSGVIASHIAGKCKSFVSVDISDRRIIKKGYKFMKVSGAGLPFKNSSFDIVISNQVIEHTPAQQKHVNEIYRVLKEGGVCYLATPNRWWPVEVHSKLPCIGWLPRRVAGKMLKRLRKEWDVYPLSYRRLLKLVSSFSVLNMTPDLIRNPDKYQLDVARSVQPVAKHIPRKIIELLNVMLPSYVLILEK